MVKYWLFGGGRNRRVSHAFQFSVPVSLPNAKGGGEAV